MGTTLQHGIFLPAEGERNCYTGLASNWTILDGVVGGYSSHAANLTIHVTAADKEAWNGKADASALTAHTGNTTIHVTAADKAAWNGKADDSALTAHTGNTTIHVTAADKNKWDAVTGKANDANVVHKSGNETISGDKVFNNRLIKNIDVVLGTVPSTSKFSTIDIADNNKSTLLQVMGGVYANGQSFARFAIQNKMADDGTGLSPTGTLRGCGFNISLPANSTSEGQGSITPRANQTTDFGLSGYQWRNIWCEKLYLNGTQLDSSLSLPSGNVSDIIDISSYITALDGTNNTYIAPANGWISIAVVGTAIAIVSSSWSDSRLRASSGDVRMLYPVLKNKTVGISVTGTTLAYARFIPCQGNI